ncbi:hypothetical protein CPB84DRAFT_1959411 [Gymnopilus junonius]|uniref:F-box domain-containing protein n=1 Tax=Gymnopilus junonius TaxID=109634 RepID=A0A9P5NY30_GYMJU|nr:hypothetical protein CPB84DRAFT_1959411 [Gymnopilus junonius]
MNVTHDLVGQRCPPEVASRIFQFCLEDMKEVTSPLTIGSICRTWRAIAYSTPQLWTSLSIPLCFKKFTWADRFGLTQQWLSRSGQLPLSIYIYANQELKENAAVSAYPLINLVKQIYNRCRFLSINVPFFLLPQFSSDSQDTSVLQTLSLRLSDYAGFFTDKFSLASPSHRPVDVSISYISIDSVHIRWDNVANIELEYLDYGDCLRSLEYAPRLEEAVFRDVVPPDEGFKRPHEPIVCQCLQKLVFTNGGIRGRLGNLLFNHVTLPCVKTLSFGDTAYIPAEDFLPFVKRSMCSLSELSLGDVYFGDCEDLISILKEVPLLQTLHLEPYDSHVLMPLFHHLGKTSMIPSSSDEAFLPFLQCLNYMMYGFCNWEGFPDIFGNISTINSGHRRPLRRLVVLIEGAGSPISFDCHIPPPVLYKLLALKRSGIDLQLPRTEGDDLLQASVMFYDLDTSAQEL